MDKASVFTEDLPLPWRMIGGSGLIAKVMNQEVPPQADPLGPENKFIVACGPLAGTMAPQLGRVSVGGKSPLTLGIKEANSGGPLGQKLDRLGIRAIVVEGAAAAGGCYCLYLTNGQASLVPATEYAGLKVHVLTEKLLERFGRKASIMAVGPAGERGYKAASVALTDLFGDPSRSAARGGLGAVMGGKGLKAIVVDASGAPPVPLADEALFKLTVKSWVDLLKHDVACGMMSKFGTPLAVASCSNQGSMPATNYRSGRPREITAVIGETIQKNLFERGGRMHGCMPGCVVKCSIVYPDAAGRPLVSAYEYEAIAMLGTNLDVADPDAIARLKYACDDLGIDLIEIGSSLSLAAEAGRMKMGDPEAALALLKEIERETALGRLLGDGVVSLAKGLGIDRVPAFKGQAIPGHDPRGAKGIGVTYATSPMGADHTAGLTYRIPGSRTGQIENSLRFQLRAAVCDTMGYCLNAVPGGQASLNGLFANLLKARFGLEVSEEEVFEMGRQTLLDQKQFNDGAEFSRVHESVPVFIRKEALAPAGQTFDVDQRELEAFWGKAAAYREPERTWEIRFTGLPSLLVGAGVIQALGQRARTLNMTRVLLIADPVMKDLGRIDLIRQILERSGIGSVVFDEVEPDPPLEEVDKAGRIYKENGCDGVVALGGGSSIDAGKAVIVRVTHPGDFSQYGVLVGGSGKIRPPLPPLVAIPTTSGTGSEVSSGSVITDRAREVKFIVASPLLTPRLAVIDPDLCKSMPPRLTVETGMDALGHCIEGYFGRDAVYQPFYESLALYGVKLVGRSLRQAYRNGQDTSARLDMCMAALHGGLALLKGLSLGHAVSHALGAHFHVPHGLGVGIGLICFVRANQEVCAEGFAELAWALDRSDDLEKALLKLYGEVGLSYHLKDLGLSQEDVKKLAFFISREVTLMVGNPVPLSDRRILELLEGIYK
jgi:aldehyde:ferredoxin oxidoreductase